MAEKKEKTGAEPPKDQLLEDVYRIFESYLRMCKMRRTPERYAVIDAVHQTDGIFTVDQIYNHIVGKMNFHLSLATTYNTLDLLESKTSADSSNTGYF